MKLALILWISLFLNSKLWAHNHEIDDHAHMLTPQEEEQFYHDIGLGDDLRILNLFFQFPQTLWNECDDEVTGNYQDHSMTLDCSHRRGMSVILKEYLFDYYPMCVNRGLKFIGAPTAEFIHLTHSGIVADKLHSPRSLHSEQRAIDLRVLRVRYHSGHEVNFHYGDQTHHVFFEKIRECWGEVLVQKNQCPPFNGQLNRTGSIGREDSRHQNHMHMSVPYCLNGSYAGNFFQR